MGEEQLTDNPGIAGSVRNRESVTSGEILSLSSDSVLFRVHLILSDAVMVNNTVTNLKSRKEGNPYQEISDTRQL